jgi:hypothetical protein
MTRSRKLSACAGVLVLVLAACGTGPVGDAAVQFGQSFAQAFRATDRAEPTEPAAITYLQVTDTDEARRLTQEPVNF